MAKRAASMKAKTPVQGHTIDPQKNFEKYIGIEKELVKTQIIVARRVDSLIEVRTAYDEFFGEKPTVEVAREYMEMGAQLYEEVLERINGLTYEDMVRDEEPTDILDDLYEHDMDAIPNWDAAFREFLRYQFVKPIAQNLLHDKRQCLADKEAYDAESAAAEPAGQDS